MEIDWQMIGARCAFLIEALMILFSAKVARDFLLLRRGYRVDQQLVEHDNVAASVDLAGFMLACVLALLDSFVIEGESLVRQASSIAMTGLIVLGLLAFNGWITDRALLRGIDDQRAVNEDKNVAVALVRAGAVIGAALSTRAAFGHPNPWEICVAWALIGQVGIIIMAYVYQWISPYDDLKEVSEGNVAAAFPLFGVLIAVGLTVEAAIYGESVEWLSELIAVGLYLLVGGVLLWVARTLFSKLFLPTGDLDAEITRDRNLGVGLLEASIYIALAQVVNYFFT